MRGTAIVNVISLAAALALLTGSAVSAQLDEPAPTPPPNQFEGVRTAIVQSEMTEPSINATIETTATFAHTEIGGEVGGKKGGLFSVTLPATPNVVRAARDLAEEEYDLVIISGGDSQGTVGFAAGYPNTVLVDIDQPLPCVTIDGRADPSGTCEGGAAAIPFNHATVAFEVDQAAYLAGVIAASASRDDILGIISGTADCAECNRTISGYLAGAQSVKPEIEVEVAYLSDDDLEVAFDDPVSAKTYAKAFIDVYEPDVLLPLTGSGSRGIIEAACEAGILAVGTDIDVSATYPELEECILTSITKDYEYAVRESVFAFANATLERETRLGLAEGHVGVTDEWTRLPGLPVDLSERFTQAEQAVITGQVETCPAGCEVGPSSAVPVTPVAPDEPDEPVALASAAPEASPAP